MNNPNPMYVINDFVEHFSEIIIPTLEVRFVPKVPFSEVVVENIKHGWVFEVFYIKSPQKYPCLVSCHMLKEWADNEIELRQLIDIIVNAKSTKDYIAYIGE